MSEVIKISIDLSRRDLLKAGALGSLATVLAGCDVSVIIKALNANAGVPVNPDAEESASPLASAAAETSAINEAPVNPEGILVGAVTFIGVPESLDGSHVDVAKGVFKNTIGHGTQMAFAEPGGLLVGPDYGFTGKENPLGQNKKGWAEMYESDGNIQPFSAVSEEVLHYEGPAYQNVPEGGWMELSTGQMHVKIGDKEIDLPFQKDNNYHVAVRGKYGDMEQNTDGNTTAELTNYKPGHALSMMLESGKEAGIGFLSEGQFTQMAETSHSGGTNLGDGGASKLTLVILDLNTGAYVVAEQTLGRNQDASKKWELVGSNWFSEK